VIPDIVLEEVERALHLLVFNQLTGILAEVASDMAAEDTAYYGALGISPAPDTPLTPPVVILDGHHPYVLERPLTDFPNVTVNAHEHPETQPGTSYVDQLENIQTSAYIEAFNYALVPRDPTAEQIADAEDLLNRVTKRYARALHRLVKENPTLLGTVHRTEGSPTVTLSNVAPSAVSDLDDQIVLFQGARLDYVWTTLKGDWQ